MRTSAKGQLLIAAEEAVCRAAYDDGVGVPTIGIGHTFRAGNPKVAYGMTITVARAFEIFANDLKQYERAVEAALTRPVPQHVFDALASLCFNIGPGLFSKSSVVRYVNAGRPMSEVAERLMLYTKATDRRTGVKKTLAGLVRRRKREATLLTAGRYDLPRAIVIYATVAKNRRPAGRRLMPIGEALAMMGARDAGDVVVKPGRAKPTDGMLRYGSYGTAVGAWQRKLVAMGYLLRVDDDFGATTKELTRRAQRALGIHDDGIVGPKTMKAMDAYLATGRAKGTLDVEALAEPDEGVGRLGGIVGLLFAALGAAAVAFLALGD